MYYSLSVITLYLSITITKYFWLSCWNGLKMIAIFFWIFFTIAPNYNHHTSSRYDKNSWSKLSWINLFIIFHLFQVRNKNTLLCHPLCLSKNVGVYIILYLYCYNSFNSFKQSRCVIILRNILPFIWRADILFARF